MRRVIFWYALAATAITIVLFLPLSLHPASSVPNVIDPLFYVWNLSHNAAVPARGPEAIVDTNIFYPLTNTLAYSDSLWGQSILASPIIWMTANPVLAQNILVFFSFVASAITAFFLFRYLTKHTAASLLAGFFYAFSFPRIAQIGHLPFVTSQWLPLVILGTLAFLKQGTTRTLVFAYISYLLSAASSVYFSIFLLPQLGIILLVHSYVWIRQRQTILIWKRMRMLAVWSIPFLLGVLALYFPYIRLATEYPEYKRTLFDTYALRAIPEDYIRVLPTSILKFAGFPTGSPEHVLYPTLAVVISAFLGLRALWKKDKILWSIVVVSALSAYVLSLGAQQTILGKSIQMPYYYLFKATPLFQAVRVPARFGLLVSLYLSIASAFGLQWLISKKQTRLVFVMVGLFFVEVWQTNTPYVTIPDAKSMPAVYAWLSDQPEQTVIAELPLRLFYNGDAMENQLYKRYGDLTEMDNYALETYRMYFSTFHKKRMTNGYSGFFPASYNTFADQVQSFPDVQSILALKSSGADIVIIHRGQYKKDFATLKHVLDSEGRVKLLAVFDNDYVYKIQK